jgi:putative aldouronate transport system substrate-binding protein
MKKSKLLSVFVIIAMILLSACSSNKGGSNSSPSSGGSSASPTASESSPSQEPANKEPEKITVHVGINWIPPVQNDGIFDKLRAEASGVYTKWTYETSDNEDTGRRLKLTGGELPDVWAFYGPNGPAQVDFLNAGVVEPVEQYLNMPDKYPNLAKIPQAVKDYVKADDGHTYFLPLFIEIDSGAKKQVEDGFWKWAQQGIFVRTDILEQTGMTKDSLATMEGFEAFLAAAAKLKDAQGKSIIPLTMGDNFNGWRSIAAAFGVETVNEAVGMFPDANGQFIATRDHENYKKTWAWLNKMYSAGLLDKEAPTHKKELYLQKLTTGRAAAYLGSMSDIAENGWAPLTDKNDISAKFEAIPFPKVTGVDKLGAIEAVNPLPWTGAYLMKGKNLEASLKYLDWTLGNDIMTVKYGPPGEAPEHVWNYVDDTKTVWNLHPDFVKDLTSGDANLQQKYGQQPWFLANTNVPDVDTNEETVKKVKYELQKKSGMLLAGQGTKREGHNYDAVPVLQGGIVEKYKPQIDQIELEYRAKLMIAKTPEKFEDTWQKYRAELDKKGKWNEYKAEWLKQYEAFSKKVNF